MTAIPRKVPSSRIRKLFTVPALIYHKVHRSSELGLNSVHPTQFAQHLQWLKDNGFQTVTYRDVLDGAAITSRSILITFDDGFESVFSHAFPIMARFNFVGVVFPVAGWLGKPGAWDYYSNGSGSQHLNAQQLRQLVAAGWEVGSHGMNHLPLAYLNSRLLNRELSRSRSVLEEATGRAVVTLAYPFGIHSPRVAQAARANGYQLACARLKPAGAANSWALARFPIYRYDSVRSLALKLQRNPWSILKTHLISWPARFTPLFQLLFKRELFIEK
ncbi:MAG: polysaccharide deacetylase family protein [Calditrichaeota bacterium]|nr:MAG: polysaccharide deacetylase family protein [Calditrichota bacterium]